MTHGAEGLFPEPERVQADPVGNERASSPAQGRRDRQLAAIARGQHPLSVALRAPLPLHVAARRDGDRTDDGTPRCGTCRLRRLVNPGHARAYPKCAAHAEPRTNVVAGETYRWEHYPRASNGEGTDLAAWWPALPRLRPRVMIVVGGPPAGARHVRSRTARPAPPPDVTDHRAAVRSWWANRRHARVVHVFELNGWHVLVTDGLGVKLATDVVVPELDQARRVARHAWALLQAPD